MTTFKDLEVEQKVKRSKHFIFLSINPLGIFSPNRAFPSVAKFEAGITILRSLIFGLCCCFHSFENFDSGTTS